MADGGAQEANHWPISFMLCQHFPNNKLNVNRQERSGKNSLFFLISLHSDLFECLHCQGPCDQHIRAELGAAEWLQKSGGDHRYRKLEAERKWVIFNRNTEKKPFSLKLNPLKTIPMLYLDLFYYTEAHNNISF